MRGSCIVCLIVLMSFKCFSQSDRQFVYTDTLILSADNCDWVLRSFAQNDSLLLLRKGKSLPAIILDEAIAGRIKLHDPLTNGTIAPDKIMTWNMSSDTVMVEDAKGKPSYKIIQQQLNPASFSRMRIFSDWFFDATKGSFMNIVKRLDLLAEVKTPSGDLRGYKVFFQLYY
jgi:hypothetical protein